MGAYDKGVSGENAARMYLESKGMRFLCGRFRAQGGEIDLVMANGEQLVFVEVKARSQGLAGSGMEAVTASKRRRLARAASCYLSQHPSFAGGRFDVIEITKAGMIHVENAFEAQAWLE